MPIKPGDPTVGGYLGRPSNERVTDSPNAARSVRLAKEGIPDELGPCMERPSMI
jgi:hypothetical protein